MSRFKDFDLTELKAMRIKIDDFITSVEMDVGLYVKTMNKISREIADEIKKKEKKE